MHAATLQGRRDASMPRTRDGLGLGAMLALLVHLLLIGALAFSVNWRTREPEGVVAELWSAVPQVAAPRAISPPPTPVPVETKPPAPLAKVAPEAPPAVDAQIAIEKAKREEAQRQQAEREAAQQQKAQREKALADETRREQLAQDERRKQDAAEKARKDEATLAALREANLKRIQGQANATGEAGSTGSATRSSGPSASYAGRIIARIRPNIVFTDSISGNPRAVIEVRCAADGTIVSRKLVTSSGNATWDEAVLRAIDKTAVLPRDVDGHVEPVLLLAFNPRD